MLLCYVIVPLRLAMGCTTSSRLVLLSSLAGETETLEDGNGGNSFCVGRDSIVRVLSDYCASRTFALSFPERPLGEGIHRGSALKRELSKRATMTSMYTRG